MKTYANEMEKRQMQTFAEQRVLHSESSHGEMRKQGLPIDLKARETNSIPLPTSAETMRKNLDKFGSSFQPTPQVMKKGSLA